jgi:hypothetical protein
MGNQIAQAALLQGGSQTVGHFGDRLAGQRIVDQETFTANFLHHPCISAAMRPVQNLECPAAASRGTTA